MGSIGPMLLISTLVSSEINLPPYLPTLLPTLLPSLPKKPYPFFETRTHSYLLDFDCQWTMHLLNKNVTQIMFL